MKASKLVLEYRHGRNSMELTLAGIDKGSK
jgi:hypothetical protein